MSARKGKGGESKPKTTLELPDNIVRAAKHKAVDDGTTLREVVIKALERYLGVKADEA